MKSNPEIPALGSFVAIPDAFQDAEIGLRNAVKFECTTVFSEEHRLQTEFSTDRILIDLGAIDASTLSFNKLARDCDLIKEIAQKNSVDLKDLLTSLQSGAAEEIARAAKVARKIGLTEEQFAQRGGGFLIVVVLVGIAVGAGGCATLNSNKPFKQPTTPRPRKPTASGGGETPTPQ